MKTKTRAMLLVLAAGWAVAAAAAEPRCPLIPMGAITGKPDEQTVKETLEAYKAVGIDQYLIYARSGLEYEYLGEDWLRMCQWFCKHAQRLDMSIWLYDEYNWPSGSCKGRVPAENQDFESRQYAVYKHADGTFDWKVVHSPGWVDNYSFPAMERFIELTHKKYERRIGPYLGTTVAGIFTDEPCDKPLVFAFEGPALKEEKSGRTFPSPAEAAAFATTVCPPAVWVETTDGKTVEDVLLRHYQDGSVVVLGLTAKEHGKLRLMRRDGAPVAFELPARGLFRFEGQALAPETPVAIRSIPADTSFEIALSACNTHRLAFGTENRARIVVGQPVAAARIVLRHHPAPSKLTLDGEPVRADQPCATLRPGLNELYRQTEPFRLEAGAHVTAIGAGGSDTNYFLPVAWVAGDFAVENGAIKALPRIVGAGPLWKHGLADFAGQVTYTTQVEVPSHAADVKLRINTGGLYTSVTLDGQALDERAWAPFEWTIPAGVRGKRAELKISVWTSVAPLFGDWKNPTAAWKKEFWVPPPEPHPDVGLLSAPEWALF